MKPIIVSGIKPSGRAHIGNFLGAIKPAVEMQNSGNYTPFFFIADLHALTEKLPNEQRIEEVMNLAADYLAAGIDPEKSVFFAQSQVSEHANLTWIFNTITSMGELERMVEYKEKVSQGQTPNAGLFDYPVLMAADILLYKAEQVPVGDDQRQHLELTRTIARNFNSRFGKTFPEPEAKYSLVSRVMSLNDATKKMSKSIESGCIYLDDSPDEIRRKIMGAQTDSMKEIAYTPESRPAIANLIYILAAFSEKEVGQIVREFGHKSYVEFKTAIADAIIKNLEQFQERRAELLKDKKALMAILKKGAKKASKVAKKTMKEVRKKVGLIQN